MSGKLGAAAWVVALALALVVLTRLLGPRLPVSEPVTVRGGACERPLEAAITDFKPEQIVSVLPRDAIQALTDPPLVPADEASLLPDELVIGVELEGEARAYSVKMLSVHEIVNDEIRGKPFAVTWCPLCHTAVVYDRELSGRILTLGVSGKLYRNSLVMYDRETGSLWSHFLGASVQGPLRGERLRFIPSTFTTWGEWRTRRPDTSVLDAADYVRYEEDQYAGYYSSPDAGILGTRKRDDRLPPKALVLGVLQPAAKAYALEDVARLGRIRDTLAGEPVEIVWNEASGQASAYGLRDGGRAPLPATPVFWFAWVDFFPGAPLWGSHDRPSNPGKSAQEGLPAPSQHPSTTLRKQ